MKAMQDPARGKQGALLSLSISQRYIHPVSNERDGKARKAAAPEFWTVGVDEIPMSQTPSDTQF